MPIDVDKSPAIISVAGRGHSVLIQRSPQLRLSLALTVLAVSWWASWSGSTWLAHHTFSPLWFGYVFSVDAITQLISGTSLWFRSRSAFATLFAVSVPLWWLFEAFNSRLDNWTYLHPRDYPWLAYHVEVSIAFSTVVPAIFVTAELLRSIGFPFIGEHWLVLNPGKSGWLVVSFAGLMMIAATLAWPDYFFPLAWLGLFFCIDPLVRLLSGWSVAAQVERGWWAGVWRLFAAGIICGFFWEMWNSRAMPKWIYDIPYAEWLHLFEMPLLGYGGYLPFALETYAFVMLFNRLFRLFPSGYFTFDRPIHESVSQARPEVPEPSIVPPSNRLL